MRCHNNVAGIGFCHNNVAALLVFRLVTKEAMEKKHLIL
jgi:hypothetical protein